MIIELIIITGYTVGRWFAKPVLSDSRTSAPPVYHIPFPEVTIVVIESL